MENIIYNAENLEEAIKKLSRCNQVNNLINLANELENMPLYSTGESAKKIREINASTIQILKNMDLLVENTIKYLYHVATMIKDTDRELAELIENSIEYPYDNKFQAYASVPDNSNTRYHGGSSGQF